MSHVEKYEIKIYFSLTNFNLVFVHVFGGGIKEKNVKDRRRVGKNYVLGENEDE